MAESTEKPPTPDVTELRKFGLIFGVLVIGAFGLLIPWIWDLEIAVTKWPWPMGGVFILWALVHPASLGPFYRGWMKFGHAVGWVNTRLILGITFFLMFAPVALLFRLIGKDPLARRLDESATTYRVASEKLPRERLERPF